MLRNSYRTQLKAATDEAQALSLVRRYLSEWKPDEVTALPPGAWPALPRSRQEVLDHSARLGGLHAAFSGDLRSLAGVQELLLFFTHAAVRLVKLAAVEPVEDCPGHPVRRTKRSATRKRKTTQAA